MALLLPVNFQLISANLQPVSAAPAELDPVPHNTSAKLLLPNCCMVTSTPCAATSGLTAFIAIVLLLPT